jgi:hypothetical protein
MTPPPLPPDEPDKDARITDCAPADDISGCSAWFTDFGFGFL